MKEIEDPRERFREKLFEIVQYLIKYELSPSAQTLINHYFNESRGSSTLTRGIDAIEKYRQDQIPGHDDRPPRLSRMLDELAYWAGRWDNQ